MVDKDKPNPAHQAELDALLQKIDVEIEQNDLHPILKNAVFLLQNDEGAWWPQGMPIENVDELKGLLDAAMKDKSIVKAVYDLLKLAAAVGAVPTGKMAGAHLLHLCNQTIHEKNLIAVVKGDAEFAPGTLEKAKGAIGDTSKMNAPKLGEKAPAGAVKIDQLPGGKRRI
jgi:hypothetical protein